MSSNRELMEEFLTGYCNNVVDGLNERWDKYNPDIYSNEGSDAIAGLLARQATLAIEFARNPGIWNGNSAPLFLRAMIDAHITMAWIFGDVQNRGREYIRYGLGQEKLQIELLQNESDAMPDEERVPNLTKMIELRRSWLNSQLQEWAIDVNVGSWSGKTAREMAIEADCESLYKFAYMPFSGAAHSMWHHVGLYNVDRCKAPLHKGHRLPMMLEIEPDVDFLYRSTKYVSKTYRAFADRFEIDTSTPLPVEFFRSHRPRAVSSADEHRPESDGT